jgi:hypothetical protein
VQQATEPKSSGRDIKAQTLEVRLYNYRQVSLNSVHRMCTNYMDYERIIADVYVLKKVLHIQILTGNQEDDGPKKILITPFAWQV